MQQDVIISQTAEETTAIQAYLSTLPAEVKSPEQEAMIIEALGAIKRQLDKIADAKALIVKPLKEHVKNMEALFTPYTVSLTEMSTVLRKVVSDWRMSEDVRKAQEEKARIESQARVAAAQSNFKKLDQLKTEHEEVASVAPKTVTTSEGTAHFRDVIKYEIVNEYELPREYLKPDESRIGKAVKEGKIIPGLHVWKEKQAVIRG